MIYATPRPRTLADLPLWRLLVMLHDAERSIGPDAPTTRTLARAVQERLRAEQQQQTGGDCAR